MIKDYNNISRLEGFQGYTKLFTKQQKCYGFSDCLKYFEDRLPGDLFLRTDKSNIVNTADVKRHFPQSGKTIAVMNSLDQVPVSPEKTELLSAMMLRNKQG
jgi:DNA-binding LytR/AlgR family response regulator